MPEEGEGPKRFCLANTEFAVIRRAEIRRVLLEAKKQHPEIVTLCLYGSTVKGTETLKSDIDGYLFVKAPEEYRRYKPAYTWHATTITLNDEGYAVYIDPLCTALGPGTKANFAETRHLRGLSISNEIIDQLIEEQIENIEIVNRFNKERQNLRDLEGSNVYPVDHPDMLKHQPDELKPSINLIAMFFLNIGNDIQEYRRYLLDKLTYLGDMGEIMWGQIVEALATKENMNRERHTHSYPHTLEEAKKTYH